MAEYIAKCPCKHCKFKHKKNVFPIVPAPIEGLYYARCPECDYYSPYQFCGTTYNQTLRNWDDFMGASTPNQHTNQ